MYNPIRGPPQLSLNPTPNHSPNQKNGKRKKKMRVTSDLNGTTILKPVQPGIYTGKITMLEVSQSQTGNPMMTLTWVLEDTGDCGDTVRFDIVMLGGTTKKGDPMPLFRLCDLLEALQVSWECGDCGANVVGFDRESDAYCCPECGAVAKVNFDTDDLLLQPCRVKVGLEKKEGTDKEYPKILNYYPLSAD